MTEGEWLSCTDPQKMLEFLRGKASDRKLRLLMAAACRTILHVLDNPHYLALVEASERVADGILLPASLTQYRDKCPPPPATRPIQSSLRYGWRDLARSAVMLSSSAEPEWVDECLLHVRGGLPDSHSAHEKMTNQCRLIRNIFGNPFHPVSIDPSWLTRHDGLIVSMARQMYDSRDFRDMPVLADALEEAGCTKADILNHCRQPGEHVRGCWVVDALLGKS